MTELAQVREHYRAGKTALFASLAGSGASTRGIHGLLHNLALHTDATLQGLWQRAGLPAAACLVAVGGYGRGQLFPHSDVDVLLLLPDDASVDTDPALKACIEQFIGSCWDSGLEIGSSVRTAAHCVEEAARDVTVQTSLLEARLLAGPRKAFSQLQAQLDAVLEPKAFFVAKTLELRQRHNKFENTPYALEPNCKESPGGLRDLQVVLWVARAAGLGKSWDDLARSGLATPFEVRQIKANEALLSLIRARLHLISGRREDRLVFDLQTAVADSFGYGGDAFRRRAAPRRNSPLGGQGGHASAERGGHVSPVKLHRVPQHQPGFCAGDRVFFSCEKQMQRGQLFFCTPGDQAFDQEGPLFGAASQQTRARHRRKRSGDDGLGVVLQSMLFVGIGPGVVKNVFAVGMVLEVERASGHQGFALP